MTAGCGFPTSCSPHDCQPIAMTETPLRKVRTDVAVAARSPDDAAALLPPGEWFVEQHASHVQVFSDAEGADHVADLAVVDFLDGLALRHIVLVSWG